jgi:hypothetical protein
MKKVILVVLMCITSSRVFAETTCTQDPSGKIQCMGFDNNGVITQSTTTQLPNGNYQTNSVSGNNPYSSTCYTTPNGNITCS